MNNTIELTKEGLENLEKELSHRESALRKELVDTLDEMRSAGDLNENEGYTLSLTKYQENETRISEIKEILSNSKIIKSCKKNTICLGSSVKLKVTDTKEFVSYSVVGENEANPLENKVSDKSPLGLALIGKKTGDTISVDTPSGKKTYEVVSVEF